jgi:hypothetical protein
LRNFKIFDLLQRRRSGKTEQDKKVNTIIHWHVSSCSPYSLLKIYKNFLKDFELEKNKNNVAKHEILKWRPNSKWTLKGFFRLKLVNLIFLHIF